jgi:V/A-type H+-transporting ATPase subunit A
VDFNDVSTYFKRVINLCKQMNYSEFKSEAFNQYQQQLNDLLAEKQIKA